MAEMLLTRAEVERRTGFRKSAIYARIAAGTFPAPKPDPDGGASVRWLASEVDAWVSRWGGTVVGTGQAGEAKAA